jgi:hypothetical protein
MQIDNKSVKKLANTGQKKKLELICADCPDKEYSEGTCIKINFYKVIQILANIELCRRLGN